MQPETAYTIVALGVAMLGILFIFGDKIKSLDKQGMGYVLILFAGVGLVIVGAGSMGLFEPLTVTENGDEIEFIPGVTNGDCQAKPYTLLTFSGVTKGSNDPTAPAGSVDFYAAGVNPNDATANRITTLSVTSGVGNLSNSVLQSCINYGIIYNGASAEYDMWYNGIDWTQPNEIPYLSTTDSAIANQILTFNDIRVVATIPDLIEENSVTGIINGQTDVSGLVNSSGELQVGADATPADSDVIYYNKTNGDSFFYLDITLGASGGNKWLKDPVLAFVSDHANPMDGDEFETVELEVQTGTDFNVLSDITEFVNGADAVPLGDWFEPNAQGVYRLKFTVVEANCDATSDVLYIYVDDMGEYLGKDILRNTKATAGAVIEIQFRE